jgi:hypothetical protein
VCTIRFYLEEVVNENNIFIYVGKLLGPNFILFISKLSPRDPTKAQDKIPIPRWSGDRKILNFTQGNFYY